MILKETEYGREGTAFCKLSDKEIDLLVPDEEVTDKYIEKCISALNNLSDQTIETICKAAKRYCLKMKALCAEAGEEFDDVVSMPVSENTPDKDMLKYFDISGITIEAPENEDHIGFQLGGSCDWEQEHGIEIIILDDKVLYLGAFEDNSPWYSYKPDEWNFALDFA